MTKNNIFDFEYYAYLELSDELKLYESFSKHKDFSLLSDWYSMCSIIGCIHNESSSDVANVLVESMGKMEYRGYDSVGVATLDDAEDIS